MPSPVVPIFPVAGYLTEMSKASVDDTERVSIYNKTVQDLVKQYFPRPVPPDKMAEAWVSSAGRRR